jgi:general secretion pathway protein D
VSGRTFLLATRSQGKLRELREIFAHFGIDVVDLATLGVPERDAEDNLEAFDTFEENALAKTRYFHEASGGLPTFGNREISTTIRLKDGETNMLAGLINDQERKTVKGVPGLSDIPGVGALFTHTANETQETDVILTLTPHIIRVLDLSEKDLQAFRVGRDQSGFVGAAVDLPIAPLPPADPAQQPAPALQQQPAQQQPGVFILQQPGTIVQPPGGGANPSPPAPTRP